MSKQLRELQARKAGLIKEARALTDDAAAENRDMNEEETSAFDVLKARIEATSAAIDRESALIVEEANMAMSADASAGTGAIEALKEAVTAQGRPTGVMWVDALSASVRPVITYWFMGLYCTAKAAAFAAAVTAGATWGVAILNAWTEGDQALWAGVLNFWFLGRVFDRVRP